VPSSTRDSISSAAGETDDAADASALEDAELSFEDLMAPLSRSDLPDIDYDPGDQKFVLRKNSLDPPYYTKLWKIDLG